MRLSLLPHLLHQQPPSTLRTTASSSSPALSRRWAPLALSHLHVPLTCLRHPPHVQASSLALLPWRPAGFGFPSSPSYKFLNQTTFHSAPTTADATPLTGDMELNGGQAAADADGLRSEFIRVLRSRRHKEVPLTVVPAEPVKEPFFQDSPPRSSEVMESCPKENIENFKELLKEENLYLITEEGEQGRLPVIILSTKDDSNQRRPAIVFLHSTNKCKEWLRPLLEAYASRGYITIAVDSRYHGERASTKTTYRDALVSSWKKGDTMPFIFDTAWDLIKLADYLVQREDIDPSRIGITGESLGGMHAWFAAFADTRYSVVVPIIGVQESFEGFQWAIDNDMWQGRVDSIKAVFEEARADLGKSAIDKEVVEKVWCRIAPGLASDFDSPNTIAPIAPRPLYIINGEDDPRCPIAGLDVPKSRAQKAYEEANCPDNFKLFAQPGIGHQMTSQMVKEASDWFDRFLKMR